MLFSWHTDAAGRIVHISPLPCDLIPAPDSNESSDILSTSTLDLIYCSI